MKKITLKDFIQNKRVMIMLSFLAAVIMWFVVANTIASEISREIQQIPIDVVDQASSLSNLGLKLGETDITYATVEVYGPRAVVGGLTANDLHVSVSLNGVTGPGISELKLTAEKVNVDADFKILNVYPSSVSVKIDRHASEDFPLTANLQEIEVQDGYVMDNYYITPETVTITGSDENIEKIDHCEVKVDVASGLDTTVTTTGDILLYDKEGRELPLDNYYLSTYKADITIPVLKKKTLALKVDFLNVPTGFDLTKLAYSFSTTEIDVAGPKDAIDSKNEIHLGYIDLRTVLPGSTYTFDITLPNGFLNIKNINTSTCTFDLEGYETLNLNVTNIIPINVPANFNVDIQTNVLNVTVIGPAEQLAELTGEDVVAELDFSDRDVTNGQYNIPVRISVPDKDQVWANGTYSVVVVVESK